MNMLQLIQAANGELGLSVPSYIAGNTATDIIQQLALLNALGNELRTEFPWQQLNTEYRFTTQYSQQTCTTTNGSSTVVVASSAGLDSTWMVVGTGVLQDTYVQSVTDGTHIVLSNAATASATSSLIFAKTKYTLPSDFDHITDRTMWDKSKHWEMFGPETPQQWQWLKSGYISTGPRIRYRIEGSTFQIWPPISTAELLGFEYISNGWARDASNNAKSSLTVDTDTTIYPDRLLITGVKKKYFEIKGFDASVLTRDYMRELDKVKAQNSGSPILSMAPRIGQVLIGVANIPDSGYGT